MAGEYAIHRGILLIFTIYFAICDTKYRYLYMRDIIIFYIWILLSYLYLYCRHMTIDYQVLWKIALIGMALYFMHYVLEERLHIYLIGRGDILYIIGLLWILPMHIVASVFLLTALCLFLVSACMVCYAFFKGRNIKKHKLALMPFLLFSLCITLWA